jgi:hypothetical protein
MKEVRSRVVSIKVIVKRKVSRSNRRDFQIHDRSTVTGMEVDV